MNWIDRILMRCLRFFVITGSDGSPYLARYHLLNRPWFGIKLHHILRSDEDRHLHDHPWDFVSIILWQGYIEHTETGAKRIRAGRIVRHQATDAHRLELQRPAWTLVFTRGVTHEWGFYADDGFMHWRGYLDLKFGKDQYTTK
jgi:hypothetical protein